MHIDRYLDRTSTIAEQLLTEIALRYPNQARTYRDNPEMAEAWGRAIAESAIEFVALSWALGKLTTRLRTPMRLIT